MEFLTSGKASVQVWSTAALEGPDAAGEPIVSLPPVLDPLDREHPNARWSPDRRMLGLLQMDGRVHLYDAQKGYAATRTFPPPAEEAEEKGSVRYFCFSPQGSFLVTWERYEVNQEKPVPNLTVWSVDTGDKLVAFIQKQHRVGILQWCADESMMFRRVTNELHCYPGKPKTPEPLRKVRVDDIAEYSVSPAGRTAVFFVPEKKGRPAIVKVVNLDSIDTTVAQKTFFQCQEVTFHWSPRGQGVCVTAACATDAQNTTYYGTSALHFLRTDGKTESTLVTPDLGPVHDVQWNPQGTGSIRLVYREKQ
jgi:translation initiation factor 2A